MLSGETPSPVKPGRGILLLSGFRPDTPQMKRLAQSLPANGYAVCGALPPGWEATPESRNAQTVSDRLTAARAALCRLREECGSVSVIGHSFGGVIALLLAEEVMPDAVVTLSAPIRSSDVRAQLFAGDNERPFGGGFLSAERTFLLRSRRLVSRARRNLFAVTAPILTVQSLDDPSDGSNVILSGVSSAVRQALQLPSGRSDAGQNRLQRAILAFLDQNA